VGLDELRRHERSELIETLRQLGPDAPTLCAGWSSEDLAAHLVVSEAYGGWPMVAAYAARRVLPATLTLRGMRSLQSVGGRQIRRARNRGWAWVLRRLSAGPPPGYGRPSVAPIRLVEEWIHHEDLRRANALDPRPGSAAMNEALWRAGLLLTGFPEFLSGRAGIEVALSDGRTHRLGDTPRVRIEGTPGEVLLFLAGRGAVAQVRVTGDQSHVRALRLAV
jgi:uncharacterized protein (TIGR03085 family)